MGEKKDFSRSFTKIVYFDEESASDLLDVFAGGRSSLTTEQVKERAAEMHARAEASTAVKFSWFPFFGGSAEAGGGASASNLGRSIFNKTLSNTILTDYLEIAINHPGIERLADLDVEATKDSAAYMRMFTPYMAMLRIDDLPINLAGLGDALEEAKGYYELLGTDKDGEKCILRFNSRAFRNNYGLIDLGRMRLAFHAILVGQAREASLTMTAEMNPSNEGTPVKIREALDEVEVKEETLLDVFDVLLAGIEHEK